MADSDSPADVAAEKPAKEIESPLDAWVRGGTTSFAYDMDVARRHAEAEERRNVQDAQFAATRGGALPGALSPDGKPIASDATTHARMMSMKLGGRSTHASIVLGIKRPRSTEIKEWMTCELSEETHEDGTKEYTLTMCCPRCVFTLGRHMADSQMHIKQSNRHFEVDPKNMGEIWINPDDPNEVVTLAGTIELDEWATCPQLGCGYRFKIDHSVVRGDE